MGVKICVCCSNRIKNLGKKNGMYGKINHGKGNKYKNIYMRSCYESLFAFFLDCNNIKWKYEFTTFDLGNTTYTPDFYMPKWNLYIEIKEYWRDDAKKKYKLFKRKYPNIYIQIFDKPKLQTIGIL